MAQKHGLAVSAIASLAACASLLASCSGGDEAPPRLPAACDRIGNPTFTGPGHGVIGPAGGVVEADPASRIAGVRVEVAPGAWSECWEVRVGYATIFDTPNYPTGYVPFERPDPSGAVDIQIGLSTTSSFYRAPDPLPFQISFPMGNIHPGLLDARSAYFYDGAQQTWRIVFPRVMSLERMTIATSAHDKLWSWGRVDMAEVDFDQHLAPALEGYYGTEAWAAMRAAVEQKYQDALRQQWQFTCAGLAFAQGFFTTARDYAAGEVDRIQQGYGCGECNPLTERFQQEQIRYIETQYTFELVWMFTDLIPVKKVISIAMIPVQKAIENCVINGMGFACDYACYDRRVDLEMHVNRTLYYGCDWIRGIVERYRTHISCP